MKVERHNASPPSPDDIAHLKKLKVLVEKALEDGKFSVYEMEYIQSVIWKDNKVTSEELCIVRETIQSVMGELQPEWEWEPYS